MALRDPAHENEITPIHVHSVEWSDRSVPVEKRTFWSLCSLQTQHDSQQRERGLVCLVSTQPFDMAFPVRWLSQFGKLIIFCRYSELLNRKSLNSHYLCSRESHTSHRTGNTMSKGCVETRLTSVRSRCCESSVVQTFELDYL